MQSINSMNCRSRVIVTGLVNNLEISGAMSLNVVKAAYENFISYCFKYLPS